MDEEILESKFINEFNKEVIYLLDKVVNCLSIQGIT